jgi:DNA-binding NarL/FixJ family response regulator
MRILIVDDHERVRRGLRESLGRALGGGSFGEAGGAAEALRLADAEAWDVVLLDLSLPDGNGVETLGELHRRHPRLPVVVMSMHPESQFGAAARRAGASGYVAKGSDPEAIAAAVRHAIDAVPAATAATGAVLDEGDRTWLSRALHDDLAQTLTALKMSLHLGRTDPDLQEARRRLGESVALVEDAIATVRRLLARLEGTP